MKTILTHVNLTYARLMVNEDHPSMLFLGYMIYDGSLEPIWAIEV